MYIHVYIYTYTCAHMHEPPLPPLEFRVQDRSARVESPHENAGPAAVPVARPRGRPLHFPRGPQVRFNQES